MCCCRRCFGLLARPCLGHSSALWMKALRAHRLQLWRRRIFSWGQVATSLVSAVPYPVATSITTSSRCGFACARFTSFSHTSLCRDGVLIAPVFGDVIKLVLLICASDYSPGIRFRATNKRPATIPTSEYQRMSPESYSFTWYPWQLNLLALASPGK